MASRTGFYGQAASFSAGFVDAYLQGAQMIREDHYREQALNEKKQREANDEAHRQWTRDFGERELKQRGEIAGLKASEARLRAAEKERKEENAPSLTNMDPTALMSTEDKIDHWRNSIESGRPLRNAPGFENLTIQEQKEIQGHLETMGIAPELLTIPGEVSEGEQTQVRQDIEGKHKLFGKQKPVPGTEGKTRNDYMINSVTPTLAGGVQPVPPEEIAAIKEELEALDKTNPETGQPWKISEKPDVSATRAEKTKWLRENKDFVKREDAKAEALKRYNDRNAPYKDLNDTYNSLYTELEKINPETQEEWGNSDGELQDRDRQLKSLVEDYRQEAETIRSIVAFEEDRVKAIGEKNRSRMRSQRINEATLGGRRRNMFNSGGTPTLQSNTAAFLR